jgi:hypothetical protein
MGSAVAASGGPGLTRLAVLGLFCGLALVTLLVLTHGPAPIRHSITVLGWDSFAVVAAFRLGAPDQGFGLRGAAAVADWQIHSRGKGRHAGRGLSPPSPP